MKAIVVTDQAAGTAGMKLVERPEPQAAINDVVVQVHASGFTWDELTWPSTWTDRLGRDRTPSIPGHELAGVVTALGYGTTGLSVGQRVFGLTDWYRDGTLAEYVAVEALHRRSAARRRRLRAARSDGLVDAGTRPGLSQGPRRRLRGGERGRGRKRASSGDVLTPGVAEHTAAGGTTPQDWRRSRERELRSRRRARHGARTQLRPSTRGPSPLGLTAWQGLFEHGRLQAGQSVLVHGAAGVVGSMVTQLAREAGAYVIGTGRAAGRQTALDFSAQEFVDLDNDVLEDVGGVDLVFDVIGGDIEKRSAAPDSSRRNAGVHRRAARGAARRRPGGRLRCRVRSCPTE